MDKRTAAQYTGKSPWAIRCLIDQGILPFVWGDGKKKVLRSDLDKYIADIAKTKIFAGPKTTKESKVLKEYRKTQAA